VCLAAPEKPGNNAKGEIAPAVYAGGGMGMQQLDRARASSTFETARRVDQGRFAIVWTEVVSGTVVVVAVVVAAVVVNRGM
jgi:hypothetical protein